MPREARRSHGSRRRPPGATTVALLVILRPEKISEMNGLAEAGATAALTLGLAWLTPLTALFPSVQLQMWEAVIEGLVKHPQPDIAH